MLSDYWFGLIEKRTFFPADFSRVFLAEVREYRAE